MTAPLRLHILGASGSGTTTLGRMLAQHLGLHHLDTDDFFWLPSEVPYTVRRDLAERLALLHEAFAQHDRWVLSGSLCGWGDSLIPLFDAVIFVTLPAEIRLERTRQRERERYGAELAEGGRMYGKHREFMVWSAGYDDPNPSVGGNRLGRADNRTALLDVDIEEKDLRAKVTVKSLETGETFVMSGTRSVYDASPVTVNVNTNIGSGSTCQGGYTDMYRAEVTFYADKQDGGRGYVYYDVCDAATRTFVQSRFNAGTLEITRK